MLEMITQDCIKCLTISKKTYGYNKFVGRLQVNFPTLKSVFPILVFDLTKQSEVIKTSAVDMRVTINYTVALANTSANALIIFDRLLKLISDGKMISVDGLK